MSLDNKKRTQFYFCFKLFFIGRFAKKNSSKNFTFERQSNSNEEINNYLISNVTII